MHFRKGLAKHVEANGPSLPKELDELTSTFHSPVHAQSVHDMHCVRLGFLFLRGCHFVAATASPIDFGLIDHKSTNKCASHRRHALNVLPWQRQATRPGKRDLLLIAALVSGPKSESWSFPRDFPLVQSHLRAELMVNQQRQDRALAKLTTTCPSKRRRGESSTCQHLPTSASICQHLPAVSS